MRIYTILFLIFLNSCVPALKLYYGYREPKPEDKKSLTKYLERKKINADNILVFKDSQSYMKTIQTEINGFPDMRVFNNDGILVYYRDTSGSCASPANDFTKMICSSGDLKSNAAKTLSSETKNLLTLDNKPVTIAENEHSDYYVFIYWMRSSGRLNKLDVKVWENNLMNVQGCKVSVYKVNMDRQKSWSDKPINSVTRFSK